MYSDGLSEAMNEKRDLYTTERLEQRLLEFKDLDTDTIKSNILSDVDKFRNETPINDDITFVAVKVK